MKKVVAMLLVLLLCSAMVVPAFADAWIPPDDFCNQYLMGSVWSDGDCYAINIFLSNYAETQLQLFEGVAHKDDAIKALMKHFELNPKQYKEGTVTSLTGYDGKTYMRIKGDKFGSRMQELFNITIDVKACPGYQDGDIVVSAENFGAPIQVYASAYYCDYVGNYLYKVGFEIFKYNGNVSKKYGIANQNLGSGDGEIIATGYAMFYYYGSVSEDEFHAYEFDLASYKINSGSQRSPYGNENLPYYEPEPETEPATESKPEESAAETAPQTEPVEETHGEEASTQGAAEDTATEPASTEPSQWVTTKEGLEGDSTKAFFTLPRIIALGVCCIALLALIPLLIILIVFRRKDS